MDVEKLDRWAKEIHDNATSHGWHEEKHSPEHYLALVMCDVAEAVEADRKGLLYSKAKVCYATDSSFYDWYNQNVKGFGEEEFADIVIRLLDMSVELYGDDFIFEESPGIHFAPRKDIPFTKSAWQFVHHVLGEAMDFISDSIVFVYKWATLLDIDLDQHIEWKMKYNESRPYKHGGKKY